MWIVVAVIIAFLLIGEAFLIIPDKMPWYKNKKEDRWWEK